MKVTTKKGYDFFAVVSALQKAVRRGEEEIALYFTVELFNSGYENYLWKRMKIYASEDIGLAFPTMPLLINTLQQSFEAQKKENKPDSTRPERLFLIHAMLLLIRSKKSRLVDYCVIKYWRQHGEKNIEIPDYAYDKHTFKGKQMQRGLDHFYDEGSLINNSADIAGEEKIKAEAKALLQKYPGKLKFDVVKKGTISQQQMSLLDSEENEVPEVG